MKKEKGIQIAKVILKTVAVAGLISMAILAPNAIQVLNTFRRDARKRKYDLKYYIKPAVKRLKEQGMIQFLNKNGKIFISLTEKGEQRLLKYQLGELTIVKPKKWDKKWRIISFDIQEVRKNVRNLLRKELVNLGFIKLQNSVWISPYDCEEVIFMLKSFLQVGKDILYIEAEKVENDRWLKKEFELA